MAAAIAHEVQVESLHPSKLHTYNADAEEHKFFDCGNDCTTPDLIVIPLKKFRVNLEFSTQTRSDPPNKWCQLPQPCSFCQKLFDRGRIDVMGTSEKLTGAMWLLACCNNRSIHRQCLKFRRGDI